MTHGEQLPENISELVIEDLHRRAEAKGLTVQEMLRGAFASQVRIEQPPACGPDCDSV